MKTRIILKAFNALIIFSFLFNVACEEEEGKCKEESNVTPHVMTNFYNVQHNGTYNQESGVVAYSFKFYTLNVCTFEGVAVEGKVTLLNQPLFSSKNQGGMSILIEDNNGGKSGISYSYSIVNDGYEFEIPNDKLYPPTQEVILMVDLTFYFWTHDLGWTFEQTDDFVEAQLQEIKVLVGSHEPNY